MALLFLVDPSTTATVARSHLSADCDRSNYTDQKSADKNNVYAGSVADDRTHYAHTYAACVIMWPPISRFHDAYIEVHFGTS